MFALVNELVLAVDAAWRRGVLDMGRGAVQYRVPMTIVGVA